MLSAQTHLPDFQLNAKLTELRDKNSAQYDPYKVPPDLNVAEDHMLATRIAVPRFASGSTSIDEASGLPIENDQLGRCCSTDQMNFLSPGYPLYFQYVKFCILVAFILSIFAGYNAYLNYKGTYCVNAEVAANYTQSELLNTCIKDYMSPFSIANQAANSSVIQFQSSINFAPILLLIIILMMMRKIQRKTAQLCDERDSSASDYSIRISNLPQYYASYEGFIQSIREFFEQHPAFKMRPPSVANVSLCYDVSEKLYWKDMLEKFTIEKAKILLQESSGNIVNPAYKQQVDMEILTTRKKVEDLTKNFETGYGVQESFIGEAFVSFNLEDDAYMVEQYFNLDRWQRLQEWFKCNSTFKFDGQIVHVVRAPNPSDIIWANLGYGGCAKIFRRFISSLASLLFLGAFAVGIFALGQKKISYLEGANFESVSVKVISYSSSILIVTLNYLLYFIIDKLTAQLMFNFVNARFEKFRTHTEYQRSYAFKLGIVNLFDISQYFKAQFLNTSVITFASALYEHNIYGPSNIYYIFLMKQGGFLDTIYLIFIYNAGLAWIMDCLDYTYIFYSCKKRRVAKNFGDGLCQFQANQIYEYPSFDFASKYAGYTKTLCSAALFAPFVPVVIVIVFIQLSVCYWLDKVDFSCQQDKKCNMVRRRSRGIQFGPEMAMDFIELLEYPAILYSLGNCIFSFYVLKLDFNSGPLALLGLTFGVLNAILPMGRINKKICSDDPPIFNSVPYNDAKWFFLEDYDRSNPATQEDAIKRFAAAKKSTFTNLGSFIAQLEQQEINNFFYYTERIFIDIIILQES